MKLAGQFLQRRGSIFHVTIYHQLGRNHKIAWPECTADEGIEGYARFGLSSMLLWINHYEVH